MARWRATPASPCPKTRAFGYDCNNRHKLEADGEDAARQTLPYDQGIPLGSSRLASHNSHSATATAARSADPECPSPSPWILGAPQSGLARLMSRINLRMSADSFGRPPRRSRLPSPVKAKTRAVPADYSFWLNNRQGAQHVRCQTIQSGEYQTIELAACRPLRRFTSQDVQLMAQHQDLCLQRDPRLEKPDQRTPDQSAELDHQADDSPDSPPPANRIRFPTGTTRTLPATHVAPRAQQS